MAHGHGRYGGAAEAFASSATTEGVLGGVHGNPSSVARNRHRSVQCPHMGSACIIRHRDDRGGQKSPLQAVQRLGEHSAG